MEKDIVLLRATLEASRAQLVLLGEDPHSLLMEQIEMVLLVTSEAEELPP